MFEPFIIIPREDILVSSPVLNPYEIHIRFKNLDAVKSTIEQLEMLKMFMENEEAMDIIDIIS